MAPEDQASVSTTADNVTEIVASADQTTEENTTAVTSHSTSAMTTTDPLNAATTVESPEDATVAVTFTEQDAPLLWLPGELRNRIYHEVFRTAFDKLEEKKCSQDDPKVLRRLLAALAACRQIHQEATPILFRGYIATKPYWCLNDECSTIFFRRAECFSRVMKRYAPHARFSVELKEWGRNSVRPQQAKALVKEIARQSNQFAELSFEKPTLMSRSDYRLCPVWRPGQGLCDGNCPGAQDIHWELTSAPIHVKGRIGGFNFKYTGHTEDFWGCCHILLDSCLAQLDWSALARTGEIAGRWHCRSRF